jgi:hypothetical protein
MFTSKYPIPISFPANPTSALTRAFSFHPEAPQHAEQLNIVTILSTAKTISIEKN